MFFGLSYIRHSILAKTKATHMETNPSINSLNAAICGSPSTICCSKNKTHAVNDKKNTPFVVLDPSTIMCERQSSKNATNVPLANRVNIMDKTQPHMKHTGLVALLLLLFDTVDPGNIDSEIQSMTGK